MSKFWKWFVTSLDKLFVIKFTLIIQTQDQPSIVDSRRKACQVKKASYSKSNEQSVCTWLPYVHLIVRESWNRDVKISQRSLYSTVNSFSFRAIGVVSPTSAPPTPHTHSTAAGVKPSGIPLPPTIPGSEADFLLVPPLLSPLRLRFSCSGCFTICFSSAEVVFWMPWEKLWDI